MLPQPRPPAQPATPPPPVRAHSDPNIFRSDRVLRALLRREVKHAANPVGRNYFCSLQTELKPAMRKEVANWMLEICEEEGASAQTFCQAIDYLDRFLAACQIRRSQLQLLAAACLLVSWKVREHSPISAQKLIEFTDFNVCLDDLLEWEFLLLSKLDWDLSAVIAPDFVEHILQRLLKLELAWDIETTRKKCLTLIFLSYSHSSLASAPASLIAVSSILTTLRPNIEAGCALPARDTPSPSSSASPASSASSQSPPGDLVSPLNRVISAVQKMTLTERRSVVSCMEKLEQVMRASLPPSPDGSEDDASPLKSFSAMFPSSSTSPFLARSLFQDSDQSAPVQL